MALNKLVWFFVVGLGKAWICRKRSSNLSGYWVKKALLPKHETRTHHIQQAFHLYFLVALFFWPLSLRHPSFAMLISQSLPGNEIGRAVQAELQAQPTHLDSAARGDYGASRTCDRSRGLDHIPGLLQACRSLPDIRLLYFDQWSG